MRTTTFGAIALLLLTTGCGRALQPAAVRAPAAKLVAKAAPPGGRLDARQLMVRRAAGAVAPRAGATVRDRFADYELHELPAGADLDAALAAYAADPAVASIERVAIAPAPPEAEAPPPAGDPRAFEQYSHQIAEVPAAWTFTRGRPDAIVAVIDTGVDAAHPDLEGQIIGGPSFGDGSMDMRDTWKHGTWAAGVIVAKADNGIGIAGVAPGARVLALRSTYPLYDAQGKFERFGMSDWVTARNIHYAATAGKARVISLSMLLPPSPLIATMVAFARGKGVVVVQCAGNDGASAGGNTLDGALVVNATDAADRLAGFSNFGSLLSVSAPGERILTTSPVTRNPYTGEDGHPTGYATVSGTSFATPFVAGIAALAFSQLYEGLAKRYAARGEALTIADVPGRLVEDVVRASCDDLGAAGPDEVYGRGRVNARAAMILASRETWLARAEALINARRP